MKTYRASDRLAKVEGLSVEEVLNLYAEQIAEEAYPIWDEEGMQETIPLMEEAYRVAKAIYEEYGNPAAFPLMQEHENRCVRKIGNALVSGNSAALALLWESEGDREDKGDDDE